MTISGFTMVRNADKFYYPLKESILSILPIVDEFVIALGDNDATDKTREIIESIGSEKIKIIDRIWSEESFKESRIFAEETNFALSQCKGDWCFYIQADEAIHELDLPKIVKACNDNLNDTNVDALLFKYLHFYGDYDHYMPFHGWYKNEMRIVRNNAGIYSYKDAQSFRKKNNEKLNARPIDAYVYHYGWVRPPFLMQSKKKEHDTIHHGREATTQAYISSPDEFNYGALGNIPAFKGTHPKVMHTLITQIFWKSALNYSKKFNADRPKFKHEKLKYRILTFLERTLNKGQEFFGYQNWNKI